MAGVTLNCTPIAGVEESEAASIARGLRQQHVASLARNWAMRATLRGGERQRLTDQAASEFALLVDLCVQCPPKPRHYAH